MRSQPPRVSTKYKSLYPTDSENQDIAIPRLASHRHNCSGRQIDPQAPTRLPAPIVVHRHYEPEKAVLGDLVEALYCLITDPVAVPCASSSIETADSTCFSAQPE
jgi:hypothetical protein